MKKVIFSLIMFVVFASVLSAEDITMVYFNPVAKGFPVDLLSYVSNETIANLNDMSDVLGNIFLPSSIIEQWVNLKINEINQTNTNFVLVKGKKVPPKKIPTLVIKSATPALINQINPYVKLNNIISINFSLLKPAKGSQTFLNITFILVTPSQVKLTPINLQIPLEMVSNQQYLNKEIKEALVTCFNFWDRFYYTKARNGSISFSITPKEALIEIPSLNMKLRNGTTPNIPVGRYIALIKATNFVTIVTNIEVAEKPVNYKINLVKLPPRVEGAPLLGSLYVDSDFPGAKFLIIEDGITGETPMLINNLKAEEKTIIFDETVNYTLKQVKVKLQADDITYTFVNLDRKGNKISILSTNEGALVVVDRKIVGRIENNSFNYQGTVGLHSLTLLQDKYVALRTNFTLESGVLKKLDINLSKKKINGFFITPQGSVPVFSEKTEVGLTPASFAFYENEKLPIEFRATNYGYNILLTNVNWNWRNLNVVYTMLNPLYGDIRVFSEPLDANVFVEGSYKGKTIEGGLSLFSIQAKKTKVRIEKDGYKPINTNIYIAPNVENQFKFTLREAPVKVYITTLPDKGFDIYVNDEWSGVSGETIIPFELGKSTIKINKRGYKTVLMTVDLKEKTSTNLIVKVEQGISEEEFIENISNSFLTMEEYWKQKLYTKSIDECNSVIGKIKGSEYQYLKEAQEIKKNFEAKLGWLIQVTNMYQLINQAVEFENLQDYKNALAGYEEAFSILSKFDKVYEPYFEETKIDLVGKIENVKKIISEKEGKEEVKKFIGEINPMIFNADKIANEEPERALEIYNKVLQKIDNSAFKDHPKVIEIKEKVNKKIKTSNKVKEEKSAWWPNVQKSWSGFNIHLGVSTPALEGVSFESGKMNLLGQGIVGINFLPFFGLRIGGVYNIIPPSGENLFIPYCAMIGANIGIPILPQWALFGEYFMTISDFSRVNILENSIANFGTDIKFDWFGIKLYYEMGFAKNFTKTFHGIGGGITFWFNEE
ncbi:MAG: PEGA domain-containing protein [Brevinematales bacterium]|nr:PEGA domain-containing protein [Brevinematales bacterium]